MIKHPEVLAILQLQVYIQQVSAVTHIGLIRGTSSASNTLF